MRVNHVSIIAGVSLVPRRDDRFVMATTPAMKDKDRLKNLHSKVDHLSTFIGVLKQKEERTQHAVSEEHSVAILSSELMYSEFKVAMHQLHVCPYTASSVSAEVQVLPRRSVQVTRSVGKGKPREGCRGTSTSNITREARASDA